MSLLPALLASCATIVGTAISPITGPTDVFIQLGERDAELKDYIVPVLAVPLVSLVSLFAGFACGLREDWEVMDSLNGNSEYEIKNLARVAHASRQPKS